MTYSENQAPVEIAALDRLSKSNSRIASVSIAFVKGPSSREAIQLFDFGNLSIAAISTGA